MFNANRPLRWKTDAVLGQVSLADAPSRLIPVPHPSDITYAAVQERYVTRTRTLHPCTCTAFSQPGDRQMRNAARLCAWVALGMLPHHLASLRVEAHRADSPPGCARLWPPRGQEGPIPTNDVKVQAEGTTSLRGPTRALTTRTLLRSSISIKCVLARPVAVPGRCRRGACERAVETETVVVLVGIEGAKAAHVDHHRKSR